MVKRKIFLKHEEIVLRPEEYLILPDHPNAKDYQIFLKGKELKDVVGIIRIGGKKNESSRQKK